MIELTKTEEEYYYFRDTQCTPTPLDFQFNHLFYDDGFSNIIRIDIDGSDSNLTDTKTRTEIRQINVVDNRWFIQREGRIPKVI